MKNKYKGEDIKARLGGTIIRYKGRPVKCEAHADGRLTLFPLDGATPIDNIDSTDDNIDISSLTLGYVNISHPDYKCAVYLKREAIRQFRQGIDLQRLTQNVLRDGMPALNTRVIEGRGLVDCVLNEYPTLDVALHLFTKSSFYSVALSRDVALKREADLLKVYVKEVEVGYIRLSNSKKVVVPNTDTSCYSVFFLEEIKGWVIEEGNNK